MSRRKVVNLNLEVLLPLIKKVCRSNVVFCEEMGRPKQKTWVTGWSNKPNPKNLPSPEEAARMCVLLQTTPDEILVEQDDIDLVNALLDNEMAKEKTPDPKIEGVDDKIVRFLRSASVEELMEVLRYIEFLESKRDKS